VRGDRSSPTPSSSSYRPPGRVRLVFTAPASNAGTPSPGKRSGKAVSALNRLQLNKLWKLESSANDVVEEECVNFDMTRSQRCLSFVNVNV
jgi:hypothetical protein